MMKAVTCVYCGLEYPEGTPSHGAEILTEHIKICEKHPMRKAEATIKKLRNAIIGIIGAESLAELSAMEIYIRTCDAPDSDKAFTINAIHALMETLPEGDK
jgi:hypothetical protein